MLLEICAFNLPSALAAQRAGADRIEFCSGPEEGGVTPSAGLIRAARELLRIPLYPIIRPREGDFLYSEEEFTVMLRDVELCRGFGCDGVVIGMLLADGRVDQVRCGRLVEAAYPMGVTFHRAFDRAADPFEAIETIIRIGCERILTSGQRPVAMEGAELLHELVRGADERIVIMPGSGVRASNIAELAAKTGAVEFHTSARVGLASAMEFVNGGIKEDLSMVMASEEEIRRIKEIISAL
ncbi:MAG TPA: copper homeostasis protein CutC [Puia sp.]|jgi:copper homeostasis protein|nr:copper homeostasis protein CutC [Puia sp.]